MRRDVTSLSATKDPRICSEPFSSDDFVQQSNQVMLSSDAIPIWKGKADGSGRTSRSRSETSLGRDDRSGGRSRNFSASFNIADFNVEEEMQLLRAKVLVLKLQTLPPSLETYENDDESIALYTGFPSYAVARFVLDLADPGKN
ncbi:unnamed protein product, partial [Didymodactylos carnosus]